MADLALYQFGYYNRARYNTIECITTIDLETTIDEELRISTYNKPIINIQQDIPSITINKNTVNAYIKNNIPILKIITSKPKISFRKNKPYTLR